MRLTRRAVQETSRWLKWATVAVWALALVGISTASATTLGSVQVGKLGAGTTPLQLCDATTIDMAMRTGYDSASTQPAARWRVMTMYFSSIPAACQGKSFTLTFADSTSGAALATTQFTGTLPAAPSGSLTVSDSQSPNVGTIESTARLVLLVEGP